MRLVALCVACAIVSGCASSKVEDFKSNSSNAKVFNLNNIGSLSATSLSANPIKDALSQQDSLINIDGQKTAFDLYSFSGSPGAHMLTMRTFCDCLGFNKDLLLPEIRVIDATGKVVETSLMNKRRVQPPLGAFYFEFTWVFDTASADAVRIVIGSNNQSLGDVATTVKGVGAVTTSAGNYNYYSSFTIDGLSVRSAPYGKYEVFVD